MIDREDDDDGKGFVDLREVPTRTGLVTPDVRHNRYSRPAEARHAEFIGLAAAIALDLVFTEILRVREIKPATYLGGGQVQQLAEWAKEQDIELLVIDAPLSAIQQRNLEREIGVKVLDRTALILEIFGERAATREGVLQVELAHLNYQKGRLVRSWTHLERQRGGGGFLGGPGETQIESDRRQIQDRILVLERRLDKVRRTRQLQRGPRDSVPFPWSRWSVTPTRENRACLMPLRAQASWPRTCFSQRWTPPCAAPRSPMAATSSCPIPLVSFPIYPPIWSPPFAVRSRK